MPNRFQSSLLSGLQQFRKVSLVPKVLCAVLVVLYLFGYIPGVQDNLVVTPSYLGPPQIKLWTLATATLYENSLLFVVLDIVAMVGFSVVLEPLWGVKEFMIFSAVVSVISMLTVASMCILIYALSGAIIVLFVNLHGFVGLVCGYLVAVKQAHPDSVAFPPPAPPTLRVKHLPVVVIFIALLLAVFKLVFYAHSLLALSGTITAWVYLRFYQRRVDGGKGDMADSFAFATFFPELMQPPVAAFADVIFGILVRLKICSKVVKTYDVSGPSTIRISLPGTDPMDAERRKQRALRALDERMSKSGQSISWPAMDDNVSNSDEASLTTSLPTLQSSAVEVPSSIVVEGTPQPDPDPADSRSSSDSGGVGVSNTNSPDQS